MYGREAGWNVEIIQYSLSDTEGFYVICIYS